MATPLATYFELENELSNSAWMRWLWEAEQSRCEHKELVHEGWANADSGGDVWYCPKCGWESEVILY